MYFHEIFICVVSYIPTYVVMFLCHEILCDIDLLYNATQCLMKVREILAYGTIGEEVIVYISQLHQGIIKY
jgi:hypothetical protein